MKTKITLFILGLGLVFTLGCSKYPPSSDRLLEDLVVVTQYDTKVNFNDYKTFAITSSITKIDNKDTTEISNADAKAVLDEISKQMTARGFTLVDPTETKPDLGIQVVAYENTNVYTYSYYSWWGYYPYYGYYYPYYPTYYSSYTTGLADIQLVDLKNANISSQELYLRWNAYIRGLVTGGHTTSEITTAVDQAFTQTPQLVTTAK